MRSAVVGMLVLACCTRAWAAPPSETPPPAEEVDRENGKAFAVAPVEPADEPPDPTLGDSYDGRIPRTKARDFYLAIPRALMMPLRVLELGIGAAGKPALEYGEKHFVFPKVLATLTSQDGKVGIRPAFEYVQSFRPSAGLQYFYGRLWHDSKITVSTQMGNTDTILATAHYALPLIKDRMIFEVDGQYKKRNDELYTGIGMLSTTPYARYGVNQGDAYAKLTTKFHKIMKVDASIAYGDRRFNNGAGYDGDNSIDRVYCPSLGMRQCVATGVVDSRVPGFGEGTQFIRQHVGGHIDSRPSELNSGNFMDLNLDYTHGLASDKSTYLRVSGRAGTAFELWKHRALYLSVSASDEVSFDGTYIPFSELTVLGGPDNLRGFRVGRFRDKSMILATLEYRWPVWIWLDGAVFVDYGGVYGPLFAGVNLHTLRPDIGFSFIAHAGNSVLVRIQFAYGFGYRGGFRFVLNGPENPS